MKEAGAAPLNFESDFFRRRNNTVLQRDRKIRSIRLRSVYVALIVLLLAMLGYLTYRVSRFLLSWEQLQVKHFRLTAVPAYSRPEIERVLSRFHSNIFTVDLGELRRELMAFGEVSDVSISRVLPQTLEITFTCRRPFFQLQEADGFTLYDVTGVQMRRGSGPLPGVIEVRAARPADISALVAFSAGLKPLLPRLEYISYRPPYGLVVKLREAAEEIYPGEGDLQARIDHYLKIKPRLETAGKSIRYADLRLENRMYLAYRLQEEKIANEE